MRFFVAVKSRIGSVGPSVSKGIRLDLETKSVSRLQRPSLIARHLFERCGRKNASPFQRTSVGKHPVKTIKVSGR